jgi:hypothetical protein
VEVLRSDYDEALDYLLDDFGSSISKKRVSVMLRDKIEEAPILSIAPLLTKPSGYEIFKKDFKVKINNCMACNTTRRSKAVKGTEAAHIISNKALNKIRIQKLLLDYLNNHFGNYLFLCSNCHKDLDDSEIPKTKLKRTIATHSRITDKMIKCLKTDIQFLEGVINAFDNTCLSLPEMMFNKLNQEFQNFRVPVWMSRKEIKQAEF